MMAKLTALGSLLAWLGLSLLVRLPFFFQDVIEWDESTYLLVGQSILAGDWLYIDVWDIKPPIALVSYAALIGTLGKSVAAVRLGGTIGVAVTALTVECIGRHLGDRHTGWLAGMVFVFLLSTLPEGQAVLTEHLAIVPLTGSLAVLLAARRPWGFFAAGWLLGVACLIRLNLAYAAVVVGLGVLLLPPRSPRPLVKRSVAYGGGIGLAIALTWLPYWLLGIPEVWWRSVVLASLSFAGSQLHIGQTLLQQIFNIANISFGWLLGLGALGWLLGSGQILRQPTGTVSKAGAARSPRATLQRYWQHLSAADPRTEFWLLLFFAGTALSILKSGEAHEHYLIQLTPLVALGAAWALTDLEQGRRRRLVAGGVAVSLLCASVPIAQEYGLLLQRARQQQPLKHGVSYALADYLTPIKAPDESLYMMSDHLVYWLLDSPPPRLSVMHPSTITREYLLPFIPGAELSTAAEMQALLAQQPDWIVKPETVRYLRESPAAVQQLQTALATDYTLVAAPYGRQIYHRRRSLSKSNRSPGILAQDF